MITFHAKADGWLYGVGKPLFFKGVIVPESPMRDSSDNHCYQGRLHALALQRNPACCLVKMSMRFQMQKRPVNDRPPERFFTFSVEDESVAIFLQQCLANALHFQQLIYCSKGTVAFTIGDDRLGFGGADTKQVTT